MFLISMLALLTTAQAEPWQEKLAAPVVEIRGGQFFTESVIHCKKDKGDKKSFQIHMTAHAPNDGSISRDRFLMTATMFEAIFALGALTGDDNKPKCKTISAPIGTPDGDINLAMTADGLQFEVKAAGKDTVRESMLWEDIL